MSAADDGREWRYLTRLYRTRTGKSCYHAIDAQGNMAWELVDVVVVQRVGGETRFYIVLIVHDGVWRYVSTQEDTFESTCALLSSAAPDGWRVMSQIGEIASMFAMCSSDAIEHTECPKDSPRGELD